MIRLFVILIESISDVRAAIIGLFGAATGQTINYCANHLALVQTTDPDWFIICAPYLQAASWGFGIMASLFVLFRYRSRKKSKSDSDEKEN